MSTISDLQAVLKISPNTGETPAQFLDRLARKANGITDDEWEALEEDTQQWVSSAIEAITAKQPIPTPDGIEGLIFAKSGSKPAKSPRKKREPVAFADSAAGRNGRFSKSAKIKVLLEKNPHREGSYRYKIFEKYRNGMTVEECLAAGVNRGDLRWAVVEGRIAIEGA